VVTVGDYPVQKYVEYIGINKYPRIPVFPKWYARTKKQPKNRRKWEIKAVLTTKKPPNVRGRTCGAPWSFGYAKTPRSTLGRWTREKPAVIEKFSCGSNSTHYVNKIK
jgi:hypothetical protein